MTVVVQPRPTRSSPATSSPISTRSSSPPGGCSRWCSSRARRSATATSRAVVALTGMLQAELQRRQLLEAERIALLERAGARLGVIPGGGDAERCSRR